MSVAAPAYPGFIDGAVRNVIASGPPPQLNLTPVAVDGFDRADGSLGSNWTALSDGAMSISGNQAIGVAAAIRGDFYNAAVFAADQYSQCLMGSIPLASGDFVGLTVRTAANGAACYALLYFNNGGVPQLNIYKRVVAGAFTQVTALVLAAALPAGTVFTLVAEGPQITGYINSVAACTCIDTDVASGAPGIVSFDPVAVDAWSGGNASTAAIPAATVSDGFVRADGGMSVGQPNWQIMTGYPAVDIPIVTNQLSVSTGLHAADTRTDAFNPDQFSAVKMGTVQPGAGGFVGMNLRVNAGLNSGYLGCMFNSKNPIAGFPGTGSGVGTQTSYRIYRLDAGTSVILAAVGSVDLNNTLAFNPAGTAYTFMCKGSRFSFRVNGREVLSAVDTTYSSGKPGLMCFPVMTAGNWTGGNID